jgi:hypothetical protein
MICAQEKERKERKEERKKERTKEKKRDAICNVTTSQVWIASPFPSPPT